MNLSGKPKPYKPQPLEPSIQESLRRLSRWATPGLIKQGPTGAHAADDKKERP